MPDKPSYLGLLNAVSNAETRAHCYLSAWAEVTTDPDVRAVLVTVAAREGEHGMAFAKRINELGFELQPTEDPGFEERLAVVVVARQDRPREARGASACSTTARPGRARHLRQLLPRPHDRHPDR